MSETKVPDWLIEGLNKAWNADKFLPQDKNLSADEYKKVWIERVAEIILIEYNKANS